MKMDKKDILFYFVTILLIFSLVITFINISKITGNATSTGTVNFTIKSLVQINFTTNIINWGSGTVNVGESYATLCTAYNNASNVSNGNWTSNVAGLVVENIGNQNVTLDLKTGEDANSFIGGTSPSYKFNVSNVEATSCTNASGGIVGEKQVVLVGGSFNLSTQFWDVNTTDPGTRICDDFTFNDSRDSIRIDIFLEIPSDAWSNRTGSAIGDIITATATGK